MVALLLNEAYEVISFYFDFSSNLFDYTHSIFHSKIKIKNQVRCKYEHNVNFQISSFVFNLYYYFKYYSIHA